MINTTNKTLVVDRLRPKTNRIALCLSGQPRFIKEGYKFYKKNLIGFDKMDVFFHCWNASVDGNNHNLTNVSNPLEIFDYYTPTSYIIEPQKLDLGPVDISPEVFVHYSMFYSIYMANKVKEDWEKVNNFSYDYTIKSRFDVALLEKLDITQIINEHKVYSPDVCGNPKVISDWFNFSHSSIMNKHTNVFPSLEELSEDGVNMASGEEIFIHHLKKINLDYQKIKCKLALIRAGDAPLGSFNFWIGVNKLKDYL